MGGILAGNYRRNKIYELGQKSLISQKCLINVGQAFYSLRGKNHRRIKNRTTVESIPAAIKTEVPVKVPMKKETSDSRNIATYTQ